MTTYFVCVDLSVGVFFHEKKIMLYHALFVLPLNAASAYSSLFINSRSLITKSLNKVFLNMSAERILDVKQLHISDYISCILGRVGKRFDPHDLSCRITCQLCTGGDVVSHRG